MEGRNLGELVISLEGGRLKVESYRLYPVDDSIAGDRAIQDEIDHLKASVSAAVFASRGYRVDQPLALTPKDLPNTFTDIGAGTILANSSLLFVPRRCIAFTANGMMRAPLKRGKTGVLTVYDVFAVAPLGAGVVDKTAGSALVTGYFTGLVAEEPARVLPCGQSRPTPGSTFPAPPACGSATIRRARSSTS